MICSERQEQEASDEWRLYRKIHLSVIKSAWRCSVLWLWKEWKDFLWHGSAVVWYGGWWLLVVNRTNGYLLSQWMTTWFPHKHRRYSSYAEKKSCAFFQLLAIMYHEGIRAIHKRAQGLPPPKTLFLPKVLEYYPWHFWCFHSQRGKDLMRFGVQIVLSRSGQRGHFPLWKACPSKLGIMKDIRHSCMDGWSLMAETWLEPTCVKGVL